MAKYLLTNQAVKDLEEIWEYTAKHWSEQRANNYYRQILNHCQEISNAPRKRKPYNGVTHNLLGINIKPHIIFYRILTDQSVEITKHHENHITPTFTTHNPYSKLCNF